MYGRNLYGRAKYGRNVASKIAVIASVIAVRMVAATITSSVALNRDVRNTVAAALTLVRDAGNILVTSSLTLTRKVGEWIKVERAVTAWNRTGRTAPGSDWERGARVNDADEWTPSSRQV